MFGRVSVKHHFILCWGRFAAVGMVAISLGACSQMTKHSNMLVFGTNTSIGANVGTDATQTPTIQIGINRQEVALVPLLANTASQDGSASGNELIPCPASTKTDQNGNIALNLGDCKFVAVSDTFDEKGNKVSTQMDSYSTLASFGTATSAKGEGASVSVAQYFATGVAAQKLAESGGASVVQAASKSDRVAEAEAEKAKADAEKAKAEQAKIEAANQKIKSGYGVALVLMGNDATAAVTDPMMDTLEATIKTPGCTKAKFKSRSYPVDSVQNFLDALNKDNPTCLLKLTPSA